MSAIVLLFMFAIIALSLYSGALYFGVRLTKSPVGSFRRCALVTLLLAVLTLAINLVDRSLPIANVTDALLLAVAELLAIVFASCFVIARVFRLSPPRAFLAWLPVLGANILMLALAWFVVRPCLVEAYINPVLNMAPTLMPPHRRAICPSCGGKFLMPVPEPGRRTHDDAPIAGICAKCRQSAALPSNVVPATIHTPDRFLVSKTARPQRWSISAYEDAEYHDLHVQRVVALPGETIIIADGVISINGAPLTPPPDLTNSKFTIPSFFGNPFNPKFATRDEPLRLGPDEFFMLGDNSAMSNDSRFRGPIKAAALRGVVAAIYWPPSRWRTFP